MLLRCTNGELNPAIGQWWTDFIAADPVGQDELMASVKNESGNTASPAKRRRRRKPKVALPPEDAAS